MNCAVKAAAAEQRGVGGIHDGVHVQRSDIATDGINSSGHVGVTNSKASRNFRQTRRADELTG